MKLDEAKKILEDNGFITEALSTSKDVEFAKKLKDTFKKGMPDGCLVKSVFAANGEAFINFAGYPRFQKLELEWVYDNDEPDEEGAYTLFIDGDPVQDGYADTAKDLTQQIRAFFAGSNWFIRRTHA